MGKPQGQNGAGELKIYFLPNLFTACNLFCGFLALTIIVSAPSLYHLEAGYSNMDDQFEAAKGIDKKISFTRRRSCDDDEEMGTPVRNAPMAAAYAVQSRPAFRRLVDGPTHNELRERGVDSSGMS